MTPSQRDRQEEMLDFTASDSRGGILHSAADYLHFTQGRRGVCEGQLRLLRLLLRSSRYVHELELKPREGV
jgi:hypothetical protein